MSSNESHHPLVTLARAAIEAYVRDHRVLPADQAPDGIPDEPAGVFVTLRESDTGDLRGCIGTISATTGSLAEETIHNAISAATRDPRFPPVTPAELNKLEIEVSVLHPAEKIASKAELDPRRYGVIVQRGPRRGLLLPDIEGIDDADAQVDMARQKAWIGRDEPVELYRFQVDKFL